MNIGMYKFAARLKSIRRQFYRVPYCVPAWGVAEHWAILRCLLTGSLIEGEDKGNLLQLVREITGMRYIFGFDSGREAIFAALKASGTGDGDKVIMPSYCCETVAVAIKKVGAEPVFCDILEDLNSDINHIVKLIDGSVKAIVFPHLFGNPGRIDKLEELLKEKGIRGRMFLIDDAAQSFGAKINGKLIGSFGDCGIVSFGPGKTITATGGGLLLTNKKELANRIDQISVQPCGSNDKVRRVFYWLIFRRWRKLTKPLYPYVRWMFNDQSCQSEWPRTLSNIDAAIALPQMRRLEATIAVRNERSIWIEKVPENFHDNLWMRPVVKTDSGGGPRGRQCVFTKYILLGEYTKETNCCLQDLYLELFDAGGIEMFPLYKPVHLNGNYNQGSTVLPNTERMSGAIFQVPLEPSISDKNFQHITEIYMKFLTTASKIFDQKLQNKEYSLRHI